MSTSMDDWRIDWINDARTIEYHVFNGGEDTITMSTVVPLPPIIIEKQHESLRQQQVAEQQARQIIALVVSALLIFVVLYTLAHIF